MSDQLTFLYSSDVCLREIYALEITMQSMGCTNSFTLQSMGRTNHKFPICATRNVQMHLKLTVSQVKHVVRVEPSLILISLIQILL